MRRHKIYLWGTLVAALSLGTGPSACSSNANTTGPNGTVDMAGSSMPEDLAGADLTGADLAGGGGPSADAVCSTQAQSTCAKTQECSNYSFVVNFTSMSDCIARYKQVCLNYLGLPGSTRTLADVQRCATAYASLSCQDYYDPTSPAQTSCRFAGTLADGIACGAGEQCKTGYCKITDQSGCGVCAQYVKIGSPCQNTVSSPSCEPGANCTGATGSQTCTALGGLGSTCNSNNGPYCKYPFPCRSGVCSQPRNLGDSCDPTVGLECDAIKTEQCSSTSRKCEQLYTFVTTGMSCTRPTMPPYPTCSGGSRCSSTSGSGTCIAPLADGAACTDPGPPSCQAPAGCRSGFCRFAAPASCK